MKLKIKKAMNQLDADPIDNFLDSLSKTQLISLVKDFAPQSFRIEIQNRYSGKDQALATFNRVKKSIDKLFQNDDLLHDPSDFESALMNQVHQLKGLEKQIPDKICETILNIIEEVDISMDAGYLDDYYNDESFYSEDFEAFTLNFIASLEFQKKTLFIKRIAERIEEQNYDTFSGLIESLNDCFSEDELPCVKSILLKELKQLPLALVGQYFLSARKSMTYIEQESVLNFLSAREDNWLIELVRLYEINHDLDKAIRILRKHIDKFKKEDFWNGEDYYSLLIDLLLKNKADITELVNEAVRVCKSSKMMNKIAQHVDNSEIYEEILEKSDPQELFEYYQSVSRIDDAYRLLKQNRKISEDEAYDFFIKNKHNYQDDAKKLFGKLIEKNLQFTGDSYYYKIEELLRNIKSIDRKMAEKIATDIRQTYHRRRNLIKIILEI